MTFSGAPEVRITSGFLRGTKLDSPRSVNTHPMGDREKLALFNMIGSYLDDAAVLDAYAGTGALGLEAISHGAKSVDFVEYHHGTVNVIERNISKISPRLPQPEPRVAIHYECMSRFILSCSPASYDVIFADPPYEYFSEFDIIKLTPLLRDDGIFVLSYPAKLLDPPVLPSLTLLKSRRYAAAGIAIYQKQADSPTQKSKSMV